MRAALRPRHARVAVMVLSLSLLAGASAAQQRPRRNSNVITRADLDQVVASSVYEAVQRLRPQWLSRPTTPSLQGNNPIMVYLDRHQMGTIEELRGLATDHVEQIEFISARDATTRYGTGHPSGVIEVTTRKR